MKRVTKRILSTALAALLLLGPVLCFPAHAGELFSDVPEGAWYAQAAGWCRETGLMTGGGDGCFLPDQPVSRAMAVTVIFRLSGASGQGGSDLTFADVPAGTWYSEAVAWAAAQGIALGGDDGYFHPLDPVSREQLAVFLWRYAGSPEATLPAGYPDLSAISPFALSAVAWAREQGIMDGLVDGTFSPNALATRSQLAVILSRFAQGTGLEADCAPSGIAVADDGSLLVTDTVNKVLWRLSGDGRLVYAGGASALGLYGEPLGGYNDSTPEESFFKEPWAIAPFLDGWAVTDAANNAIRLVRTSSVSTVNGTTSEGLTVTDLGVAFARPTGLAADDEGNLYVSDTLNNAVRRITPQGVVSTAADGLSDPTGLCWSEGALYIAETGANRIVKLENGRITVVAGSGEAGLADGPALQASFYAPQGVAVGEDGTVYVSDTVNGAVRRVKGGKVDTLASHSWDVERFAFISPRGLVVREGRLYVCDNFAHKILVLRLEA